jgi:hypothetical protein
LELPLSYNSFISNLKGFEFRYIEKQYYILFFAVLEMLNEKIIKIESESQNEFIVTSNTQNKDNLFTLYQLLLRPFNNNKKIELKKYIYRIGIYGYYMTNIFSEHSIKKVIRKELLKKDLLVKKGIWPFISYNQRNKMQDDFDKINLENEKNKFISKINSKLNFNKEELEMIINTIHSNLLISLDTIRPAITLIGK